MVKERIKDADRINDYDALFRLLRPALSGAVSRNSIFAASLRGSQ